MNLICEAKLQIANALTVVEYAIPDMIVYCRSISHYDGQYSLEFETATAAIRTHDNGLLIRVEAEEVVVSLGAKMLIASHISQYAIDMPIDVLWIDASEQPFATIMTHK